MNVKTLYFIRDENNGIVKKKKVAVKQISKTQRKKLRMQKRIKLKETKESAKKGTQINK